MRKIQRMSGDQTDLRPLTGGPALPDAADSC